MGDVPRKIDLVELLAFSDDLIECLRDKKDATNLAHCLEDSKALLSSCDADFGEAQIAIEDYQKKVESCKQKIEEAKSEVAAEEELNLLQKELEEELEREQSIKEELRAVVNGISELENQRLFVEEQKRIRKRLEQDEMRNQRKLSMYASVTNIIPNLYDHSKVSGHIVDRDKKVVEKFEFDSSNMTDFDMCNSIWKLINL